MDYFIFTFVGFFVGSYVGYMFAWRAAKWVHDLSEGNRKGQLKE